MPYGKRTDMDFDFSGINRREEAPRKKKDWIAEMLKIGGTIAPAAGTATGALLGSLVAPGVGTAIGAGIGGAAGSAMGGVETSIADGMGDDERQAEEERLAREEERRARTMAAGNFLGGF